MIRRDRGFGSVRIALDQAAKARTKRQKRTALTAITEAQADLARDIDLHALDREFAALTASRNWSNDRIEYITTQLAQARDRLEMEIAS